ncbi:ferritin-like domain-containing protein [Pelotalea chapellei]|uniref:Ferritin family protein n=1 Tax=Pelotalea chapellei TaxID=44671 RepID=A0ABS5U9S7_9BACT|nr:ferritin family protein [Pelotalea chapellei]MBT1072431.1 ferritin family protein [Pelotalea chapellei]
MNILDFALKMELDGKAYYEKLAVETDILSLRTIFINLAADEQKHYDIISSFKAGTTTGMADSTVLEDAKNVFECLRQDNETLGALKKSLHGYEYARKIEADSIKLYEEMADKESDTGKVALLQKIAAEERKHYNIMDNLADFTLKPEYYLEWREFSNLEQL